MDFTSLSDNTPPKTIHIRGARVNNLKNITCAIPHGQLTVITGPSGSGKSSLAFDTLYAEGQRRFVESMSSYARQFLERLEKPDVDKIEHILPAIALEQKNGVKNARSTVGTATEITDYLRLLFATVGVTHCQQCDGLVESAEAASLAAQWSDLPEGSRLMLLAPLDHPSIPALIERGFFRAERLGEVVELQAPDTDESVSVVIDRWIAKSGLKTRILESIQAAYQLTSGICELINLSTGNRQMYRQGFRCKACGAVHQPPTPHLFSFNSPLGACPTCEGFGRAIGIDASKVIPNPRLTLAQGAILPYTTPANRELMDWLLVEGKKRGIRLNVAYEDLDKKEIRFVWEGAGEYPGVNGFFEWLETKKYKVHVRVFLSKYRSYEHCPTCHGTRLRPEAMQVSVDDLTIDDISRLPIRELQPFFDDLTFTGVNAKKTHRLLSEIKRRLAYMTDVGLGYLNLARPMRTLSGGEAQRIHLSSALGSALTETMYVLDEPTVGLHARDTERLLAVLYNLRAQGNTVIMVEHDPDMILGADYAIELGPEGGEAGGRIVYEGIAKDLPSIPYSALAMAFAARAYHRPKAPKATDWFEIVGATGNNLNNVTVRLPKHQLICVTGVSGSGKSTLIKQTLYAGYQQNKGLELNLEKTPCEALIGLHDFADVLMIDQSPPGRSARSNPATYTKAYDDIRQLFAGTRQSKILGLTPGDFSFNTTGGRCDTCEGLGYQTIDMQFMADVTIICPDCKGRRFKSKVLQVRWPEETTGKNLDELLNLTLHEAVAFFIPYPKIANKLKPLVDIGLGYLTMGQSTSTLSGGEAQRLKLASHINEKSRACLFLFDEPTTGLHLKDIHVLIAALRQLLVAGHSVVVIEHHLDFIAQADYILDLGPEGGDLGGEVLFAGPVEDFAACTQSVTARALATLNQTTVQIAV